MKRFLMMFFSRYDWKKLGLSVNGRGENYIFKSPGWEKYEYRGTISAPVEFLNIFFLPSGIRADQHRYGKIALSDPRAVEPLRRWIWWKWCGGPIAPGNAQQRWENQGDAGCRPEGTQFSLLIDGTETKLILDTEARRAVSRYLNRKRRIYPGIPRQSVYGWVHWSCVIPE